jgi:hypothetical protein
MKFNNRKKDLPITIELLRSETPRRNCPKGAFSTWKVGILINKRGN